MRYIFMNLRGWGQKEQLEVEHVLLESGVLLF